MSVERPYLPGVAAKLMTAEDLLDIHVPNKRVELVRGVLVVHEPPGYEHGRITAHLALLLGKFVEQKGAGQLVVGDTGFRVASDPDTVRGPDLAFIRTDRVPDPHTHGFPLLGPDLVVEVLSPSDRPGAILAKVGDWLEGGARLVWIVDPARRQVRIYRQDGTESVQAENAMLDGEDVLLGFSCSVAAIL